jgi:hypothetical protein
MGDCQKTLKIIVTTFGLAWRIQLRTVRPSPVPGMWRSLKQHVIDVEPTNFKASETLAAVLRREQH